MNAALTVTDTMGDIRSLLETGGVAVAVILALGVVIVVVGKSVFLPIAKTVTQAMGDHRESAASSKDATVAAKDAAVASREAANLARQSVESAERVADRLMSRNAG